MPEPKTRYLSVKSFNTPRIRLEWKNQVTQQPLVEGEKMSVLKEAWLEDFRLSPQNRPDDK